MKISFSNAGINICPKSQAKGITPVFSGDTPQDSLEVRTNPLVVDTTKLAEADKFAEAERFIQAANELGDEREKTADPEKKSGLKIEINRSLEPAIAILISIFKDPSNEDASYIASTVLCRLIGQQGNLLLEAPITKDAGVDKYFEAMLLTEETIDRVSNPVRKAELERRARRMERLIEGVEGRPGLETMMARGARNRSITGSAK